MAICLVGLGSNLGDRVGNLLQALDVLRASGQVDVLRTSSFVETTPVGGPEGQPNFFNGAALIATPLAPQNLLALLLKTESQLGRVRTEPWGPRTIDLDLLLYDDQIIQSPSLQVPHPRLHERSFVLGPAVEIAPDLRDPASKRTLQQLLAALPAASGPAGLRVFTSAAAMQAAVREAQRGGRRVGVVPTMGALHEGHLSLVRIARERAEVVVATIFVNPTQFGPSEDFAKYPRTLEADLAGLARAGCNFVFVPTSEEMYPPGHSTFVEPPAVAQPLEGVCRPGHFRGVATVVLKLLNIVPAEVACFGQKDYQQAQVIRQMAADLNLPTEIVVCPTTREPDGLAMSSRNRYLSPPERQRALALSQALAAAERLVAGGEREGEKIVASMRQTLVAAGIERVDYVALADPRTLAPVSEIRHEAVALIACFVGTTRLIDNQLLSPPQPA